MEYSEELQKIHANQPQLVFYVLLCKIALCIFGRGTGKTEGITGFSLLNYLLAMPRSVGGLLIPSYATEGKITSGIYKTFEKFGYVEGEHYVIGKKPPIKWKDKGFNAPRKAKDFEHYVSFYNGSGFYILSAETAHNGSNLDWFVVEEARLIKEDRFKEIYLAVRGNEDKFGYCPWHGALLLVTDRPQSPSQEWVYHFEQPYKQPDNLQRLQDLLHIYKALMLLEYVPKEVVTEDEKGERKKEILWVKKEHLTRQEEKQVIFLKTLQSELRKKTFYVGYASTLDNIHVLGIDKILDFEASLSQYNFGVSVLNLAAKQAEHAFYRAFNQSIHGYTDDYDVLPHEPLHIACDINNAICTIIVAQVLQGRIRIVNTHYVNPPLLASALPQWLGSTYAQHPNRLVHYYYDHTMYQGKNGNSNENYVELITTGLTNNQFAVEKIYIGAATTHEDRYKLFTELLSEPEGSPIQLRYNRNRCQDFEIAVANAKVVVRKNTKGGTSYEKDKTLEKDLNYPQQHATHYTEAMDMLIVGVLYHYFERQHWQIESV